MVALGAPASVFCQFGVGGTPTPEGVRDLRKTAQSVPNPRSPALRIHRHPQIGGPFSWTIADNSDSGFRENVYNTNGSYEF